MNPEDARLAKGSRFEDRYEILGELGSGSSGQVYRARQLATGKAVALKLLAPPEDKPSASGRESERFRRETEIGAALSHTNIVELIDRGETRDGRLYAVFTHVAGETLEQTLAREGRLEVRECVRLMTQVLDALACAHAQGIVHRDIKPSNLMLSGTGARRNALVLDFGLGGVVEGRRRRAWRTLTRSGAFVGTPLYASPEQLAGEPATPRSDLYAWGLVFLECLTGQAPFAEGNAVFRDSIEIPEWLREHRLGALLASVTVREPAKRDLPVEALIEALDEIASGELPVAPETSSTPPPLTSRGERRRLTVMFCDLVGSTALSQQLDAETYREIVRGYQARGAEAVERYGGRVVQYLGDGLLVYFGHPQAHEDDAERAIRAGREVLRGVGILSSRTEAEHGVPIAARVGIHTGPVVLGQMGGGEKRDLLALGDTPNVAARLESIAEPCSVVVSDATLRLVPGIFLTQDLGTPELKGIDAPVRVHEVRAVSGIRSRLDRAGLTSFVGREQELGLLLDRFEQAEEGRGQAVLVGGEAGIGKSRLVRELRERLREAPHSWLECHASPYTQGSALHALIEMLERGLDFREEDAADERLARLERGLAQVGVEPEEAVPLLASLLSLRLPERYPPLELSPQLQRQKTLEALLAWLLASSEKQTVVLAVEDLHWIDPSTLEWLGSVLEHCATARVLLVMTHRPDFEPPWPPREHVLELRLNRLGRRQSRELVARAIAGRELPDALVERIAGRSDGVPLFVEELAKGVAEAEDTEALDVPETLQDSLMARLDRLGDGKQAAQIAAAIGRDFEVPLLEAVAPLEETALREALDRLVEAELVHRRGPSSKARYTFKHVLVQDTAYGSLLESQRREIHGRLADALEQRFPERVAGEPEILARHAQEAGRTGDAIGHYRRAGERATKRFAQAEAVAHFRRALELLRTLPRTAERDRSELQLQLALGSSLIAAKGYSDAEVEAAHERARALCDEAEDSPELVRARVGLSMFYTVRRKNRLARELAEQAVAQAERTGDPYLRVVAHTRLGLHLCYTGQYREAHEHLEEVVRLYEPDEHRSLASDWGQDWGIVGRSFAAYTRMQLGQLDRARRLVAETLAAARQGDPHSLAFAAMEYGFVHGRLGEHERARKSLEEAVAIAQERSYPMLGTYRVELGRVLGGLRGLEEIREGIGQLVELRHTALVWAYHRYLAEWYLELGRVEEAQEALDAAYAWLHGRDNSALQHTRGRILWRKGASVEAERCLRRALEMASDETYGASHDALLAATDLARLLRDRDRRDEARALLEPVYASFTEGFDTQPLKDARALLDELATAPASDGS